MSARGAAVHWLWRLDAGQWLHAADHELARGHEHVGSRRVAVAHARRGAGMALNAVLVTLGRGANAERRAELEAQWGRSYVDHLRIVGGGSIGPLPPRVAVTARELLTIGMEPGALVHLGAREGAEAHRALALALEIREQCALSIGAARP